MTLCDCSWVLLALTQGLFEDNVKNKEHGEVCDLYGVCVGGMWTEGGHAEGLVMEVGRGLGVGKSHR